MVSEPTWYSGDIGWGDNLDPLEDGFTHINVYSKGLTHIGRLLTNFAPTSFTHPTYGYFSSMEGYWYWVTTGMVHDELRDFGGYQAKVAGKRLPRKSHPDFERLICEGLAAKLACNSTIHHLLVTSSLPLCHYYVYGSKMVVPRGGLTPFYILFLEDYRTLHKA